MNTNNTHVQPSSSSGSTSTPSVPSLREHQPSSSNSSASTPSIPSLREHPPRHSTSPLPLDESDDGEIFTFDHEDESLEQKQIESPQKERESVANGECLDRSRNGNLLNNTTSISIETITAPMVYDIAWLIDEESLDYACLKNKNKTLNESSLDNDTTSESQRGVLDTIFSKNGRSFKLELCISGWKNSNRGYCAFYLTIPQIKIRGEVQPLTARYTVTIKGTSCYKQSSVRDDFHLGVGFPNFCTEEVLSESQKKNDNQLELKIKIEIFKTSSTIKQIENEIYHKFVNRFGAINGGCCSEDESRNCFWNPLLIRMYKDKTFCDVVIRCRTSNGNVKLIEAHKSILVHSSVVFEKMLVTKKDGNCSFMESHENEINLEDSLWNHTIVHDMIKFMYCGQISAGILSNIEYLFELFRIAEYYSIGCLMTECCNQFILTLNESTVCFLLLNLDNKFEHVEQIQFIHENDILWRFMIQNIKKVKKTGYYKQILLNNPQILNKLIDKMTS